MEFFFIEKNVLPMRSVSTAEAAAAVLVAQFLPRHVESEMGVHPLCHQNLSLSRLKRAGSSR